MTRIDKIIQADARYKKGMAELQKTKGIEDQNARAEAIANMSKLIVSVAYDRAEAYELLAFVLIQAADKLMRTSYELLDTVKDNVKYKDKFKLKEAMRLINKMVDTFDEESAKVHEDYFKHGYVEDGDTTPFDAINHNSDVILHFIMLIYNALKKSKGNAQILERSLRKLKGVGEDIFPIEEIYSL